MSLPYGSRPTPFSSLVTLTSFARKLRFGSKPSHNYVDERRYIGVLPLLLSLSDRIPIEIYECIIGYLGDKRSLCACSLVCRTWFAPSRHRLSAMLVLRPRPLSRGFFSAANRVNCSVYVRKCFLWKMYFGDMADVLQRVADISSTGRMRGFFMAFWINRRQLL